MRLDTSHSLILILVVTLCTMATRFSPFLLFPAHKTTPQYIIYLGKVLPFASMGLLVVYCLKNVAPLAYPYALPELIAVVAVVALQLWKRKSLLSIGFGTALYMVLEQIVFSG